MLFSSEHYQNHARWRIRRAESLEKSVTNSSPRWGLVFLSKSDILFGVEAATDKLTELK